MKLAIPILNLFNLDPFQPIRQKTTTQLYKKHQQTAQKKKTLVVSERGLLFENNGRAIKKAHKACLRINLSI